MAIIQKRYAHLNQADSGSLHRKLDATEAYITGSLTAASTLSVAGQADFDDKIVVDLDITGSANLNIALESNLQGAVYAGDLLDVAGDADFAQAVRITGELTGSAAALLSSTLKVDGQADMVDVLPQVDLTYDLGSPAKRWAELHAGTAAFTNLDVDYLDVAVTASVAQLTGSAGAVFSAGDVLVQAGKVSASSDVEAGGALTVAGNADLNGQLDVAAAATFHSTVSASGDAQLGGTLTVAGNADLNGTADVAGNFTVASTMFSVIAATGDTSIAGDLVVSGDLTVMGDRIEAQISELRIEDGLITLMSGSTSRAVSAGAGVEVDVGDAINGARPTLAFSNAEDAWTSNLDFNPTADLTYDLGIPSKRWNEINAGSGSFAGPLSAATVSASAGIEGGSFATDGTLTVQGAADLNGGLDVVGSISASADVTAASFAADGEAHVGTLLVDGYAEVSGGLGVEGAVSASAGVTAASFAADGLADFGSLQVAGTADLNGGLNVIGAVSASEGVTAASFTADGLGDFGSLDVTGNATLTSLTASVGAEIQGPLSASELTVGGNAVFNGTATFNGTFAVPGTGDFGSLVVGGINLSPISSSNPVSTMEDGQTVMLTQTIESGDMAKFEVEVIARGLENAAAWKISVAAIQDGNVITAAATELSKEFFGLLGAQLDVDINVVAAAGAAGPAIQVIAKGAQGAAEVFWDAQIVKKMVLGEMGQRKY
jgi:hypothetical protein